MDRRPQFQAVLSGILGNAEHVYFQPPSDVTMVYPCIVYDFAPGWTSFADDQPYFYEQQYEVKLIGQAPQPEKFELLRSLPKSLHSRSYVAENLRHDVFDIYF